MDSHSENMPFVFGMPSPSQLERWPNWVDAPEVEDGANEDVIVPENQQSVVSEETRWTAAEVKTPSGLVLPALIGLRRCEPHHVCVRDGNSTWELDKFYGDKRWTSVTDRVSRRAPRRFPLQCRSRLVRADTRTPLTFVVNRAKFSGLGTTFGVSGLLVTTACSFVFDFATRHTGHTVPQNLWSVLMAGVLLGMCGMFVAAWERSWWWLLGVLWAVLHAVSLVAALIAPDINN